MGYEYALIYMNMPNCVRTLKMPEYAKIYPNVANMPNVLNMADMSET